MAAGGSRAVVLHTYRMPHGTDRMPRGTDRMPAAQVGCPSADKRPEIVTTRLYKGVAGGLLLTGTLPP